MTSDWGRWMRAALAMGIAPEAFWRLSWREWRLLADASPQVLPRDDLTALMARFPDISS